MTPFRANFKEVWSRLTWPDLVSTAVAAGGVVAAIFGFSGGLFSFLKYLAVIGGVYLFFRFVGWGRSRRVWTLRDPLILRSPFVGGVARFLFRTLLWPGA